MSETKNSETKKGILQGRMKAMNEAKDMATTEAEAENTELDTETVMAAENAEAKDYEDSKTESDKLVRDILQGIAKTRNEERAAALKEGRLEVYRGGSQESGGRVYNETEAYIEEEYKKETESSIKKMRQLLKARSIMEGVVIRSRYIDFRDGAREVQFEVTACDEAFKDVPIWIGSEEMTNCVKSQAGYPEEWTENAKSRLASAVVGTKIEFVLTGYHEGSPDRKRLIDRQASFIGSRVLANEKRKDEYFHNTKSPKYSKVGSILLGEIIAVYPSKILFNVGGIDLMLSTRLPYITDNRTISAADELNGQNLFKQNEKKPCQVVEIMRDENNKVVRLKVDFATVSQDKTYEALEELEMLDVMYATVLRPSLRQPNKKTGKQHVIVSATPPSGRFINGLKGVELVSEYKTQYGEPLVGSKVKIRIIGKDKDTRGRSRVFTRIIG